MSVVLDRSNLRMSNERESADNFGGGGSPYFYFFVIHDEKIYSSGDQIKRPEKIYDLFQIETFNVLRCMMNIDRCRQIMKDVL